VNEYLDVWEARGAAAWYDVWWEALSALRLRYAGVIGAESSEIALHASVSTATAVLASALDYTGRSKIVTTSLDFPTVAYQWLAKHGSGIDVEIVESPDGISVPIDLLASAVDERTALVATSHVFFTSGCIQDIRAVADVAHAKGALCYVDAYQSVGQVPFAVLKPTVTGWFAHERQFDFDMRSIQWHEDARRFEQGTPSLAAVYTQLGGLELIEELGIPVIREVTHGLTEDLIDRASEAELKPRVAPRPEERSAIVMIPRDDPAAAVRELSQAGIVVDARPGHVRISPFFYNLPEDYDAAIEILRG
jgi:selenocysteine lyase/cysteine desulfurase